MISEVLLSKAARELKRIADMLVAATTARPSRAEPEEPAPQKLRQSEMPGIDMNDLRRAADRERKSRRLPRSPEECRRWPY
jgi:hypothetical protein